jgi:hypothetical protein
VSQSFVTVVRQTCRGWPGYGDTYTPTRTVVLYVGDFDPSGMDIERDLVDRAGLLNARVVRLGVTEGQVRDLRLVPALGKARDSRSPGFIARYGGLYQVEVEALSAALPGGLVGLVRDAVEDVLDLDLVAGMVHEEHTERERLRAALVPLLQGDDLRRLTRKPARTW